MATGMDYTGLAALVIAVGSMLDRLYNSYKTRKEITDSRVEQRKAMAEQNKVLEGIKKDTNGAMSATKHIADTFGAEIERVAQGGTPTPYGIPSPQNPVTLSAGKAQTQRPPIPVIPPDYVPED